MNDIILFVGLGIFIIGGIGLLIAAFRSSVLWGLAVLFIPPAIFFYLFTHWQNAKGAFKTQIFGAVLMLVSIYFNSGSSIPASIKSFLPSAGRVNKCVTANGETYYGKIPSNVVCQSSTTLETFTSSTNAHKPVTTSNQPATTENFSCDGREYCSQMTSCAEAMYFNSNCPNTKMSGDGDGIPCERQWCGH